MKISIEELREKATSGKATINRHSRTALENEKRRQFCTCGGTSDSSLADNGDSENNANTHLIMHCLNTHQILLDALREIYDFEPHFRCMPPEEYMRTVDRIARKAIEAASTVEVSEMKHTADSLDDFPRFEKIPKRPHSEGRSARYSKEKRKKWTRKPKEGRDFRPPIKKRNF